MAYRWTRSVFTLVLLALAVFVILPVSVSGQTFRGGISGTVTDQSGAVVPGAMVTVVETATNTSLKTVSSSAGEFAFTNLPLGDYSVTVSASGFSTVKVKSVTVSAGVIGRPATIEIPAASKYFPDTRLRTELMSSLGAGV